jgi:hypothetical protein
MYQFAFCFYHLPDLISEQFRQNGIFIAPHFIKSKDMLNYGLT